jgi:hypothetical protein
MRVNLFLAGDLKVFLPGAAAALACGLLLGGAMQPHLDADDRPVGPQIIAAASGERSDVSPDTGLSFAAYHGQVPDYVLGTDWKKTMAWPDERAAVSPPTRLAVQDDAAPADPPVTFTRAAYDEPTPQPHAYPSLGGGAGRGVHAATDADVAANDDTLPANTQGDTQGGDRG